VVGVPGVPGVLGACAAGVPFGVAAGGGVVCCGAAAGGVCVAFCVEPWFCAGLGFWLPSCAAANGARANPLNAANAIAAHPNPRNRFIIFNTLSPAGRLRRKELDTPIAYAGCTSLDLPDLALLFSGSKFSLYIGNRANFLIAAFSSETASRQNSLNVSKVPNRRNRPN
jgi:hypothetical protein